MEFKTKIEKKEKGIIEVMVTMPFSEVKKNEDKAVEYLSSQTEIEGFRKGKAPKDVVEAKLGKDKILQEAAQQTINQVFTEVLQKEKLNMIGYPAISVVKLAEGNDFEFKVELTVYPEVKLPDYKKIVKGVKKEKVGEVTKEDLEKVEKNLLDMQNKMALQGQENKDEKKQDQKEVTELTDDFVKKLGPFKNVAEFKEKIKEDLKMEKENQSVMNHREGIVEGILKETDFSVPELLVNAELDKIIAQLKDDVTKNGLEWKKYLENAKKTEQAIREEFSGEAEKRAKVEVILKEIAKTEKLQVDIKELQKQQESIEQMYPNTDKKNIRLYLENILINEAVIKFLEK